MGSVPPVESIRISDQITPVRICTDATCEIAMLSSVVPKSRGFTRLTCSGLTTMRVGKIRLPRVHRLALKDSPADAEGTAGWLTMQKLRSKSYMEIDSLIDVLARRKIAGRVMIQ